MSKKIAFGWYGGKYSHLDWLLPLLPKQHTIVSLLEDLLQYLLTDHHHRSRPITTLTVK